MSNPVQLNSSPVAEFQTQFGTVPGTLDARAECEKWQRLCTDLMAERDLLRTQLAKERAAHERTLLKAMCAEVDPNVTMNEVYSQVDRETSFEQLIDELKQEAEAGK